MTVGELIEKLQAFPEDMEVVQDWDDGYSTLITNDVELGNKYYNKNNKEVVIIK